jgi:adenosylhomocysteine nucleosidase
MMDRSAELLSVSDRKLLFVIAAELEYGPHLRSRFKPLITGVGPVEAGVALGACLASLKHSGGLPNLVVSLGSAGSSHLDHCGVYQISSVSYRDMDASPLGFEKGRTPLLDLPATLNLPMIIPGIPTATLSTGANVVSGDAYASIPEDMVDMETFALLRACQKFDVPLIGLRGISDGKAPLTGMADWTDYLHIIDEKLGRAVDLLLANLNQILSR